MDMDFETSIIGDKGYIKVSGNLDNEDAGEALRRAYEQLYSQGKRTILLDLLDVQTVNSYGVGKILMCHKRLKAEGGELIVKLDGFVKELFELLMLHKLVRTEGR